MAGVMRMSEVGHGQNCWLTAEKVEKTVEFWPILCSNGVTENCSLT